MPNQTPAWVVDELLAEAVVRPTLGARRYADGLCGRGFQDLGEWRAEDSRSSRTGSASSTRRVGAAHCGNHGSGRR